MRPIAASSESLAILALLALAGCATAPPPIPDVQQICLPMTDYSAADQKAFASEVNALPAKKYPHVVKYLGDYHQMRVANRACKSSRH